MSTIDLIAGTNPEPFSTSKTSNWVARTGGLPTLIQHVSHDLLESGSAHTVSEAVERAVGIVHDWADGHDGHGHLVHPATVAEARKAITEWEAKRAAAKASPNLSDVEREALELAFNEKLHPRVPRGKQGGGRFTAKNGGGSNAPAKGKRGIRPRFQIKTDRTAEQAQHRHARDLLYGIAGLKKGGLTEAEGQARMKASDLPTLARRWNAQSKAKRLAAMRAFKERQATLPPGWHFDAEGRLHIDTNLARRIIGRAFELARYSIVGPDVREQPVNGESHDGEVSPPRILELAGRRFLVTELADPSMGDRVAAAKKGQALPGKNGGAPRFPIRNRDELERAIKAVGRARPNTEEERSSVRKFIISRAKALGLTSLLPDTWNLSDGSLKS